MRRAFCAVLLCVLAATAAATDYRADTENYRDHLRHLQPGDRLLLEPGDYRQGFPLKNFVNLSVPVEQATITNSPESRLKSGITCHLSSDLYATTA